MSKWWYIILLSSRHSKSQNIVLIISDMIGDICFKSCITATMTADMYIIDIYICNVCYCFKADYNSRSLPGRICLKALTITAYFLIYRLIKIVKACNLSCMRNTHNFKILVIKKICVDLFAVIICEFPIVIKWDILSQISLFHKRQSDGNAFVILPFLYTYCTNMLLN